MHRYIARCLQCKGFEFHEHIGFHCVECEYQYIAMEDRKIQEEKEYRIYLRKIIPRPSHFADNMRRSLIYRKYGVWVKPYSLEVDSDVD